MAAAQEIAFAVLFSVVLVFNIAGNSLVIYIITNKRGMKTSTNYLLLNLAVADLLFGVFLAPRFIFLPFFRHSLSDEVLGDWLCKLLLSNSIAWFMSRASVFTMLCLTVERYFAVCRPHTFSQRFSSKIVKILVGVSWVYAIVMISPIFPDIRFSREYFHCVFNGSAYKAYLVYSLVEITCALSIMIILPIRICISLWCEQTVEATGEREITERKKKKKVTYCVLAVLVTFVVCWIPTVVILAQFGLSSSMQTEFTVTLIMTSINAALDPYLFSFQSSRFKILVKKIICCRKESVERN